MTQINFVRSQSDKASVVGRVSYSIQDQQRNYLTLDYLRSLPKQNVDNYFVYIMKSLAGKVALILNYIFKSKIENIQTTSNKTKNFISNVCRSFSEVI